ncbi:MAG: hypothetical protein HY925_03915 [Elusimicrobia bacterium]|nr:hypothetical protein [Elusimicrobiota bacterium]
MLPKGKTRAHALLALLALGILATVSAEFLHLRRQAANAAARNSPFLQMPAVYVGQTEGAPPPEPAPSSPPPAKTRESLSIAQFLSMARAAAPKPLADQVIDQFMKAPALRNAYREYAKPPGSRAPAAEFVAEIAKKPEVQKLVNEFKDAGGFKAAWLKLSAQPGIADALAGRADGAAEKTSPPVGAHGPVAGAGPVSGKPLAPADPEAIRRAWARKAAVEPGAKGGGETPSASGSPAEGGAANAAGDPSSGKGGAEDKSDKRILSKLKNAGPDVEVGPLSKSAWSLMNAADRKTLEEFCARSGCEDAYACDDAGLLAQCEAACRAAAAAGHPCGTPPQARSGARPVSFINDADGRHGKAYDENGQEVLNYELLEPGRDYAGATPEILKAAADAHMEGVVMDKSGKVIGFFKTVAEGIGMVYSPDMTTSLYEYEKGSREGVGKIQSW